MARACLLALVLACAPPLFAGQNVVILLDDSGSMADVLRSNRAVKKIDAARAALRTVLEKLPADAQVGVVVLNRGDNGWLLPLAPVDKSALEAAIGQIRADGGTPLGRFMKVAADALLELRSRQRYGNYKLLIVTDGEAGDAELVERYLPDIQSRGIAVDVIGVDMRGEHSLATKVETYRRADDPGSLQQAISEVVLGESSADSGDAGESDFEFLAGFPTEVATAALAALSQQANQPIGEERRQIAQGPGDGAGQVASGPAVMVPVSPAEERGASGSALGLFCGLSCLGLFVLLGLRVALTSKR
jgi:hypothetical protein